MLVHVRCYFLLISHAENHTGVCTVYCLHLDGTLTHFLKHLREEGEKRQRFEIIRASECPMTLASPSAMAGNSVFCRIFDLGSLTWNVCNCPPPGVIQGAEDAHITQLHLVSGVEADTKVMSCSLQSSEVSLAVCPQGEAFPRQAPAVRDHDQPESGSVVCTLRAP